MSVSSLSILWVWNKMKRHRIIIIIVSCRNRVYPKTFPKHNRKRNLIISALDRNELGARTENSAPKSDSPRAVASSVSAVRTGRTADARYTEAVAERATWERLITVARWASAGTPEFRPAPVLLAGGARSSRATGANGWEGAALESAIEIMETVDYDNANMVVDFADMLGGGFFVFGGFCRIWVKSTAHTGYCEV